MVVDEEKVEEIEMGEVEASAVGVGKASRGLVDPAQTKRLPLSILACLIGLILGPVLPLACAFVFDGVFNPLFAAAPLLICLFNLIFKGGRDIRALIATAVFSLASAFLSVWACSAVLFLSRSRNPVSQIFSAMGRPGAFPISASAYAYPLVFTALGIVIVAVLYRGSAKPNEGPELGDEDECAVEGG